MTTKPPDLKQERIAQLEAEVAKLKRRIAIYQTHLGPKALRQALHEIFEREHPPKLGENAVREPRWAFITSSDSEGRA